MTPTPTKGKRGAVTITLPWPPSINGYWRSIVRGKRPAQILSERGREYRDSVSASVLSQGSPSLSGAVRVHERFYPPTLRKYDIDNFRKAYRDGLVHAGVIEDDHLIHEDHGIKCPKDKDNPRVEITIEPMEGAA